MATCANPNCNLPTSGKSKYCRTHKAEARQAWKEMIGAQAEERNEWKAQAAKLFERAMQEGYKAGKEHTPTPMVVQQHASVLDDSSPVVESWHVAGGVCGFGWVTIYPGNCKLANFARENYNGYTAYHGGCQISIREFGQSYEMKMKMANVVAQILEEGAAELDPRCKGVYSGGRLD